VTITVVGVNDDPVAIDDEATTDEDTPVTLDVLANDDDVEKPVSLTVVAIGTDANPTARPAGDVDGDGAVDVADLAVLASHWNQGLVTRAEGDLSGDGAVDVTDLAMLAASWGADGPTPRPSAGVDPIGEVTIHPDGTLRYDPNDRFETLPAGGSDTDRFTYTVSDGQGGEAMAEVVVTIEGVNDAPVADANGPYTGIAGQEVLLDASGSYDVDEGDALSYEWDVDSDGTWDYTTSLPTVSHAWPVAHAGNVTLRVSDTSGASDTDVTTVEIAAAPIERVDDLVSITYGPIAWDPWTDEMMVTINVTNTSEKLIAPQVRLAMENITGGVTMVGPDGTLANGSPWVDVSALTGGNGLAPGEGFTRRVHFHNAARGWFDFTPSVWGLPQDLPQPTGGPAPRMGVSSTAETYTPPAGTDASPARAGAGDGDMLAGLGIGAPTTEVWSPGGEASVIARMGPLAEPDAVLPDLECVDVLLRPASEAMERWTGPSEAEANLLTELPAPPAGV
jgi:VCBS repeat-containing protein